MHVVPDQWHCGSSSASYGYVRKRTERHVASAQQDFHPMR